MTSKQRAKLKALAANIKPIFQIGKGGVGEQMIIAIKDALYSHELIKISVLRNCDYAPQELMQLLEMRTGATGISVIGSKITLYKFSNKEGIENIEL